MAFHLLGLSPDALMTDFQFKKFGKIIEVPLSGNSSGKGVLPGDRILAICNSAKLNNQSVRDYMIKNNIHTYNVDHVADIAKRYEDYKALENIYDYTDMLFMITQTEIEVPELDYLFIDEAQDLSSLQWYLVNKLAEKAGKIIVAGDDKQSINDFAGADVDTFLHLPGKVKTLEQSYRVPYKVYAMANKIMSRMYKYRPEGSKWRPKREDGTVNYCYNLPFMKMLAGEWLILGRTIYQLEEVRDKLIEMSTEIPILFTINGQPPLDMDIFKALEILKKCNCKEQTERLFKALTITEKDNLQTKKEKLDKIKILKKFITAPNHLKAWEIDKEWVGKIKGNWYEVLDKVPMPIKYYISKIYKAFLEEGEDLFKKSKIRLMTIHAAKGREADNVVVCTDVPRNVRRVILDGETDTEAKIMYVAVTRAKKRLYIYNKNNIAGSLQDYLR